MSTPSESFAISALYDWFEANKKLFKERGAKPEFKNSGYGSAYVRLETKMHLVELCAWDNASCLDIQIMEIESEKTVFPHLGSCESKTEFDDQLREFITWFGNQEQLVD